MELGRELSTASLLKLLSFLFWSGSYLWCIAKEPGRSPEWYSRAITLLHGSIATYVGLLQCGVRSLSPSMLTSKYLTYYNKYLIALFSIFKSLRVHYKMLDMGTYNDTGSIDSALSPNFFIFDWTYYAVSHTVSRKVFFYSL